jgi:hypothetical protein
MWEKEIIDLESKMETHKKKGKNIWYTTTNKK